MVNRTDGSRMAHDSDYSEQIRRELEALNDNRRPMREIVVNAVVLLLFATLLFYVTHR